MVQLLASTKPYRNYIDLVELLESRGMVIPDKARAERKLAQIGYYRLSGFWYPCRKIKRDVSDQIVVSASQKPVREDAFQPSTNFQAIIELYLFDKKLRQLMLDAIDRIEVYVRSVIAHEVGYHSPLAYQDSNFINPSQTKDWTDKQGKTRNIWSEWADRKFNRIRCNIAPPGGHHATEPGRFEQSRRARNPRFSGISPFPALTGATLPHSVGKTAVATPTN